MYCEIDCGSGGRVRCCKIASPNRLRILVCHGTSKCAGSNFGSTYGGIIYGVADEEELDKLVQDEMDSAAAEMSSAGPQFGWMEVCESQLVSAVVECRL
eukprot:SAG31_NODE_122_length_23797_cov_39.343812_1_plen_99_part_00